MISWSNCKFAGRFERHGEALDYIEARKRIYIPLYAKAVVPTAAFQHLLKRHRQGEDLVLWDFDGYASNRTFGALLNDPQRPLGHAFVLKALLERLAT